MQALMQAPTTIVREVRLSAWVRCGSAVRAPSSRGKHLNSSAGIHRRDEFTGSAPLRREPSCLHRPKREVLIPKARTTFWPPMAQLGCKGSMPSIVALHFCPNGHLCSPLSRVPGTRATEWNSAAPVTHSSHSRRERLGESVKGAAVLATWCHSLTCLVRSFPSTPMPSFPFVWAKT